MGDDTLARALGDTLGLMELGIEHSPWRKQLCLHEKPCAWASGAGQAAWPTQVIQRLSQPPSETLALPSRFGLPSEVKSEREWPVQSLRVGL